MRSYRIGRFRIAREIIDTQPAVVRELMGRCIIIRAEYMFASNDVEYLALCDDFEEIAENEIPGEYAALFRQNEDGSATFEGWRKAF